MSVNKKKVKQNNSKANPNKKIYPLHRLHASLLEARTHRPSFTKITTFEYLLVD